LKLEDIPAGAVVLIDSTAFIYLIDKDPAYFPAARSLFDRVQAGEITAIASTLVLAELLVPYYRTGDPAKANVISATLQSQRDLEFLPVSPRIAERAARLRGLYGLHTPDAVHAATALHARADWLVTNARKLRRVTAEGIQVLMIPDEAQPPLLHGTGTHIPVTR
jgi:predicted nucleic acid-binding protein